MFFVSYLEKYCRAGQTTDDNMVLAHCMLETKVYKYTHRFILLIFPLQ